jgi:hypothetical protein
LEADEKVLKIFTDYSEKGIKLETEVSCISAQATTTPYESHEAMSNETGEFIVGSPK